MGALQAAIGGGHFGDAMSTRPDQENAPTPFRHMAYRLDARAPVLELRNVRHLRQVGTPNEIEVLHGIDLRLHRGGLTVLTGPSGAGKSTLLRVAGLIERPSAGRVALCGCETRELDDQALAELRRNHIGTLLQHHQLVTAYSALENVLLPMLDDGGATSDEMQLRAARLIAGVGLARLQHRRAGLLDRAQQQLVAIARALALEPALLLADEPTGDLDPQAATIVTDVLLDVQSRCGVALLLVTRTATPALRHGDMVRIAGGTIGA